MKQIKNTTVKVTIGPVEFQRILAKACALPHARILAFVYKGSSDNVEITFDLSDGQTMEIAPV